MKLYNHVLIQPSKDNTLIEGVEVENLYDKGKNVPITGYVKAAPTSLVCKHREFKEADKPPKTSLSIRKTQAATRGTMEWETVNEVQKGDFVVFKYINMIDTEVERILEKGVIMPYQDLYCKIGTDGTVTPLNGYILFEADEEETDVLSIKMVKDNLSIGTVRHVGTPNTAYMYHDYSTPSVKEGDKVVVMSNKVTMLESPVHQKLFGCTLWAVHPIFIVSKI